MLFTILTDNPQKFINNPLVVETFSSKKTYKKEEFYLVDGFEKALELNMPANYLNNKIQDNIYWFEESPDSFIIEYFQEKRESLKITPLLSSASIKTKLFSYENNRITTSFDESNAYIIDKNITNYFDKQIEFEDSISYENTFRLKIKQLGLVTEAYTLKVLETYIKKLFNKEYWVYILIIFSELFNRKENFIAEYELNGITKNAWKELFKVENYLNNIKIYSAETQTIDLNFKKDSGGQYYIQYNYSGAESTTGRIYTTHLDGYQALQNLSKTDRHVLKAEKDCYLVEIDYKSFEFQILCCLLKETTEGDPHKIVIDYLFPDKDLDRQIGKNINYSIIYGKNIAKIAEELSKEYSVDFKEIEKKLNGYGIFEKAQHFSTILKQMYYNKNQMLLKNYFNRWIKIEKEYAILNNFIQSTGADFLYLKFNLITDFLRDYSNKNKILLQNHDSLLIQLEIGEESEKIFENIMNIINQPYEDIHLKADYKYGFNWGNLN